jgi:superfamily II DNA/RNA helicase
LFDVDTLGFLLQVDHVILFDFPQEPSEYVRRVGRTGRAGRQGKVTVLVHGRQVPIAKQVIGASIDGKRIDPVPELSNLRSITK